MSFSIEKRPLLLAGVLVILGALIVITPWYIFPVCEAKGVTSHQMSKMSSTEGSDQPAGMSAGTIMRCGYTARAEAAVGALVILAGLTLIALPERDSRKAQGFSSIRAMTRTSAAAFISPTRARSWRSSACARVWATVPAPTRRAAWGWL